MFKYIEEYSKKLDVIPRTEWARIWTELKKSGWAKELGEEPKNNLEKNQILKAVSAVIEIEIGEKNCQRHLYKEIFGFTDQMFDDWWFSNEKRNDIWEKQREKGNNNTYDCKHYFKFAFFFLVGFLLGSIFFCFLKLV